VVLLGRWRQRDCHAVSLVARRGRHIGRTALGFPFFGTVRVWSLRPRRNAA